MISKIVDDKKYHWLHWVVSALFLMPNISEATNGYFAHGYGVRSRAMAGTGAALPQDAVAAAINPAGMAYIGDRLDLELELFNPHRKYAVEGPPTLVAGAFPLKPGAVESDSEYFPVPTLGWSHRLDNQQTIGLALYGNGGMNTDYPGFQSPTCPPGGQGTFCGGRTGVDLMQLFISPSYARSFAEGRFSLGIAPIFAVQAFKARGFGAFAQFSSDPQHVSNTNRDFSYGAGVRVGGLIKVLPNLSLGGAYKSRVFMSPFADYAGLFAEQGDFDIPESFNIGLAWHVADDFTAAFDIEQINYSSVNSVGNPLLPNLMTARLGDNEGAGFGWRDMTIYKLGAQWRQNKDWTWRAGLSYGEQPIPDSQTLFNIAAPGVQEWHLTTGFSHALDDQDELSFALMYSPANKVRGADPLSPSQTVELEMYQLSFQIAFSRRF